MSDKEPGEDARPRGGYTPGMFAEIDCVDKFAEALGVPKQTIALVTPMDIKCRSSGCPFMAVLGNQNCCPAHRRSWYPLKQHRGEQWLGPEFLRAPNGNFRDCDCNQQQCRSAGYFPGQSALYVKRQWRAMIAKTPYLLSAEKSKAYQDNPDKSIYLYPWHFYPEHRERQADGEWRLKDHRRGETYKDENGGVYSYPPPHYLVQHFLDNEYFVDTYVRPQDRWALENPDSRMPTWMLDMIAADHSFAASQNSDPGKLTLRSLSSSQPPDLHCKMDSDEVEGSLKNDDDTAAKIETFLLGRLDESKAETETETPGNISESTTSKIDSFIDRRSRDLPQEHIGTKCNKRARKIQRDRCRKEEWVHLPADPIAMACPDVVEKQATDSAVSGDKKAAVNANSMTKAAQIYPKQLANPNQGSSFCREEGCPEFCDGESDRCIGCKARRIGRLFNIDASRNQHMIDRKNSIIYNLSSFCKVRGCQKFRNWKSEGFCMGCFNARRDGQSFDIDESVEEAQNQARIKRATAARAEPSDNSAGSGDKNALAEADTTNKTVQIDRKKSKVGNSGSLLFCKEAGCSEFRDSEGDRCIGCKARRIGRLFNVCQSGQEVQNKQHSRGAALWQKHFNSYVAHMKKNGAGANVAWKDDPKLYDWIRYQRNYYHNNSLDKSREKKLREVGFDFKASKWRTCFERLSQHVAEHGTIPGAAKAEELVSRRWWTRQLKKRERGDLSEEQLDCLREIESQLQQPFQKRQYPKRRKMRTVQEDCESEPDDRVHVEADGFDNYEEDEKSSQCDDQYEQEEENIHDLDEKTEVDCDIASDDDGHSSIPGRLKNEAGMVAGITLAQESAHWEAFSNALDAHIQNYGHPPRARDESPALYDWIQLQKERQKILSLRLT